MLRNVWFQLHWIVGTSFGVVLAVVGVTGGILSFEQPIIKALSHGVMTVAAPAGGVRLQPDELLAALHAQAPAKSVRTLGISAAAEDAVAVTFAGGGRRGTTVYADPYTGQLLGPARGRAFMGTLRELHRWMLLDIGVGRPLVGVATLLLLGLCLSGLYLRWPRQVGNWRAWLTLNFRQKGRSFLWHLHAVFGTWALLLYLLAALTGLWWSFDWYRDGVYKLAGVAQTEGRTAAVNPDHGEPPPLDRAWAAFTATVGAGGFQSARLTLPSHANEEVRISYLPSDAAHARASDSMAINATTGAILRHDVYRERPRGERFISSIFPLHSGEFFGLPGLILMMLASLGMPVFAITGWMLYLDRRRSQRAGKAARRKLASASAERTAVLVTYASQTGHAERYAWQSAGHLQAAGIPVTVKALGNVRPAELAGFSHALFSIASFGDAQAPDNARSFARHMLAERPLLAHLRFGLLALGDRSYQQFCGFGKAVGEWLHARGARALFDDVQVHLDDADAIALWQRRLGEFSGHAGAWNDTPFQPWRLTRRGCINAGSAGGPIWQLDFATDADTASSWQAGDLVEILIEESAAGRVTREYSIASVPADGTLQLLLREARHPDGRLGAGSQLLLETCREGDPVSMRIRHNDGFRVPPHAQPLILIGNGTGMAGLRSHLRARELRRQSRNWLVFGERHRQHDYLYRDEIKRWHANGHLQRLDLAFSRDQPAKLYVQNRLREAGDAVRQWVDAGATILVCGSLQGMAPAVEATLIELLGPQRFDALLADGRYRRDVY